MLFDTHLHTIPFSSDSGMVFADLVKAQKEQSLGVILTEHVDYAFGNPKEFYFEPEEYFKALSPYRSDRLLLGVEVGWTPDTKEKDAAFASSHPFDMVIGSIHFVKNIDIYYPEFFALFPGKYEAFLSYMEQMEAMVMEFSDFDTLGHMDYIGRTAPYADPFLYYEDYPDIFDRIFKTLIKKEKALEINTRQFNKPDAVEALRRMCLRYRELGGRMVTIGSDAHRPEAVGAYLKEAYDFARACDLTPVYFKDRKAVAVAL